MTLFATNDPPHDAVAADFPDDDRPIDRRPQIIGLHSGALVSGSPGGHFNAHIPGTNRWPRIPLDAAGRPIPHDPFPSVYSAAEAIDQFAAELELDRVKPLVKVDHVDVAARRADVTFYDRENPGFAYEFFVHGPADALHWVAHMAEKTWVSRRHLELFARHVASIFPDTAYLGEVLTLQDVQARRKAAGGAAQPPAPPVDSGGGADDQDDEQEQGRA